MSGLGEVLVSEALISQEQLAEVLEDQRVNGGRLGNCLVRLGYISEDALAAVLSN